MKTIFLAGLLSDDPIPGFSGVGDAMKEHLILLGALLLVAVVLIAWAYLSRRTRRKSARREERRHRHSIKEAAKGVAEIHKYVKERQGGRRREHRPRNPTLAETGGLPPIRSDTQSPPTSPH